MPKRLRLARGKFGYRLKGKEKLIKQQAANVVVALSCAILLDIPASWYKYSDRGFGLVQRQRRPNTAVHIRLKQLMQNLSVFKDRTRFKRDVWQKHICDPLVEHIPSIASDTLTIQHRILRWSLVMRGAKMKDIAWEFGQSYQYTLLDVNRIAKVFRKVIVPRWIKMAPKGSPHYEDLANSAQFGPYPTVKYAADVSKIYIRCPTRGQADFFPNNKRRHCISILGVCDGWGIFRHILGPAVGTTDDVTMIRESNFKRRLPEYLELGDKILYDGALATPLWHDYFISLISVETGHSRKLTEKEKSDDYIQRCSRIIIEHAFERLKDLFEVIDPFQGRLQSFWMYFASAAALTNIHSFNEAPLRERVCSGAICPICKKKDI